MTDGPARLVIDFASLAHLRNFVGWLREDDSSLRQPFGADVNAFEYQPGTDDRGIPDGNLALLVPGIRVPAHKGEPLLPVPGEAPPAPRGRHSRGRPDDLFAPHGTDGGSVPPGKGAGVTEVAPY
jgi:hypothetical protein